jgi:hypothetical protein
MVFIFGAGGGIPIVGDWDNDGIDTVGVYVPTSGVFFLRNQNSAGNADIMPFQFGPANPPTMWLPVAGDWNNDGLDTIGLYHPASGSFFLKNANIPGGADITVSYGAINMKPVVGDWNNDGTTTIGIYSPATGAWFLRNSNTPGGADLVFTYGPPNAGATPLAGDWNGL